MGSTIIRIPASLCRRLEFHAQGVDTPVGIIIKSLDCFEKHIAGYSPPLANPEDLTSNLDVEFSPSDEEVFKRLLVVYKHAWVLIQKDDGTRELKEWNAQRFTEASHLRRNLRSGCLRNWRENGIVRATVAINKCDITSL